MKTEIGGASIAEAPYQRPATNLSDAVRGARGKIVGLRIEPGELSHGVPPDELERRLLEIGFVEGVAFEVLHVGLIGADPIAVRVNDTRIALRRREARAIAVTIDSQ